MKKPAFIDGFRITLTVHQWEAIRCALESTDEELSNYIADETAYYLTAGKEPLAGITIYGISPDDLDKMYNAMKSITKRMIEQAS